MVSELSIGGSKLGGGMRVYKRGVHGGIPSTNFLWTYISSLTTKLSVERVKVNRPMVKMTKKINYP